MRRRFLYRLRGGNQDCKESEKAEEFHVMRCLKKDSEGHQKAAAKGIGLSSHAVSHAALRYGSGGLRDGSRIPGVKLDAQSARTTGSQLKAGGRIAMR